MDTESKSRVVHEKLDTTFVNLWALLRSLSQREFIGRVRVEMKDYTADVFMNGSNTPLVHEIDRAAGTDTLEEGALHRLVLRARETPGTISVFEGADEAVAVKTPANPKAESGDSAAVAEHGTGVPQVNSVPDAIAATGAGAVDAYTDQPSLPAEIEAPTPEKAAELPPPIDLAFQEPSIAATTRIADSSLDSEPGNEIEWEAVVKASGELVGGVERALNNAGADFASVFKAARLELADDYTFLDPMSDGFTYSNSAVTLDGEMSSDAYVAGLSEALRRVVDRIAKGDRARRVRERVALELFSVARKRKEILTRSGFLSQLDRIAGTKVQ
jgi:hypothetical protein